MSVKTARVLVFVSLVVVVVLVLVAWNPLRASPGRQDGVDLERYNTLKSRVEELRSQGRDVSRLDQVIADIDAWIAQGKVAEANLRITDLESDLDIFDTALQATYPPEAALPPAPAYLPAPQSSGTVLFQEDFSSPDALAAWQGSFLQVDPGNMASWRLHQAALQLYLGAGGMQWVGMIDVAGQDWTDSVLSVDVFPRGSLEVGAIVRYQNGAFYRFRFLSGEYKGVPTRLLERVEGDKVTVLAQAEGPGYDYERWYNIQVAAVGSQLTVYLDGQSILQATDGQLTQGKAGVYGLSNGDAFFDNVRVTSAR